ncbi:MarR family winged helix-turn-helix transcriptional regulator [Candidatus Enterococcus ferrettii]|uniref:HTH marR-type domain-containing protein n=1 Tax=Candidatus Enterococcus ferrettii TaxID=2815324 RepID=A0ABV0ESH7_9ENTE|nr:MarR family transcriptional regulator [Enterococcus sp. 665A]MBO1342872.1 MarR family transcriptional regulator [Enterococcus sp. 665A]
MENLSEQLMKMQHELRRYHHRQMAKNQTLGPHRGQGRVLALLKMTPEISQKDLTFVLGMRPQSVGELLQKLEDKEWITREASEVDRRVMIVRLTEAGREAADKLDENPALDEELFAQFSEEEKAEFARLIDKLLEELNTKMEEDPETFGGGHGFEGEGHHHHGPNCGYGPGHGHGPGRGPGHHHFHPEHFTGFWQ